jgi:hypothetical protein
MNPITPRTETEALLHEKFQERINAAEQTAAVHNAFQQAKGDTEFTADGETENMTVLCAALYPDQWKYA